MFELPTLSIKSLNQRFSGDEWPLFNDIAVNDEQIEIQLSISDDLSFFAGHFPGQPVLPGIVQIHWAGELAKFILGLDGFMALKNIKFNSMVLPSSQLKLVLKYNQEKQTLRFDYSSESEKRSNGLFVFSTNQGAS